MKLPDRQKLILADGIYPVRGLIKQPTKRYSPARKCAHVRHVRRSAPCNPFCLEAVSKPAFCLISPGSPEVLKPLLSSRTDLVCQSVAPKLRRKSPATKTTKR